ncbi:MAG TPA: 50S ribosomal protein L34e [Candidatus Nanoarchaeia archaeon]|nr:50S ribosomal protein L34e [Candidatus Nanoarchaeia archaeon]
MPKHKTRTFRKVRVKLASRVTIQYRKRNPAHAQCGNCGKNLQGVPRARPVELRTMPKTKKRPERPYGGVLCSGCMRALMIEKARL